MPSFFDDADIVKTSYGRTALLLALQAAEAAGKEVLLPAFTCPVGVVGVVVEAQAKPVFVDIDLTTLSFDYRDLQKKITSKSAAIISHHYFGMINNELERVQEVARQYHLLHIEDCAHSLGASKDGQQIGGHGDLAIYSLSKNLCSPGGGLLKCNANLGLREKIQQSLRKNTRSLLDTFLLNVEVFSYLYQLTVIRKLLLRPTCKLDRSFAIHQVPRLWHLFTNPVMRLRTKLDHHQKRACEAGTKNRLGTGGDLSMTALQHFFIRQQLPKLQREIGIRRSLAQRFSDIAPHYYPEGAGCQFVYTNYVVCVPEANKLIAQCGRYGLVLSKTWPAEGSVVNTAITPALSNIREMMVLLELSTSWQEDDIAIIEDFFYSHKAQFYHPLDSRFSGRSFTE